MFSKMEYAIGFVLATITFVSYLCNVISYEKTMVLLVFSGILIIDGILSVIYKEMRGK